VEGQELHDLTAAYALNALDEREAAEYEAHLGRCPDCQRELASLREAAARLAYVPESPAPPRALRKRILDQARRERGNVVPLRPRWALPAAAGVAAVAASVAIGLGIWAASLSSSLDDERQARAAQERAVAVLIEQGADRIPLQGASGGLYVTPDGRAALVVEDLDEAPGEKIYEAWVGTAEPGRMQPAGTFEATGESTVFALDRPVVQGGLVAVTIEDRPEAEPSGDPLFTART
jgi:anti-sigma factor RsiW